MGERTEGGRGQLGTSGKHERSRRNHNTRSGGRGRRVDPVSVWGLGPEDPKSLQQPCSGCCTFSVLSSASVDI